MFDRCGVGSGLSWPVSYNYMYLSGFENTPSFLVNYICSYVEVIEKQETYYKVNIHHNNI